MFCPEDGAKIPLTEEIAGAHPIYECPKCGYTWVYDSDKGTYRAYPTRALAMLRYGVGEIDVFPIGDLAP